ncbi:hypothetical protein GNF76_13245 [Pseudomonas sp. CCM 7893]|uniref:Uncharacterized protein n=1 Tax=Pseudomonas spelaei TaxID=1055469 RepID=A0A6I3WDS6_9PSED|nr:hypothetical protein [Pseudomonas spelaei]MUF05312.1 hypothetical protein [Pseudomonas spelaei]
MIVSYDWLKSALARSSPANTTPMIIKASQITVTLLCPSALLLSYFWSVWIPRYLLDRSLKASVRPLLNASSKTQHCTVVFRLPVGRDTARQFLTDIGEKYPGSNPEIIALAIGNALGGDK